HSTVLTAIDFSPDGRRILTASADRSTRIWDARSGAAQRTVYRSSMPMSVHFSCDGSRIIVAENNGTATVEDAASRAPLRSPIGPFGQLTEAIFSPPCELIATAGSDGTVRLWDAQTFRLLQVHTLGKRPVNDVAFDRRGTRLVAAGGDDAVHVFALPQWDGRPG